MSNEAVMAIVEALDRNSRALIRASENIERGLIYFKSRR